MSGTARYITSPWPRFLELRQGLHLRLLPQDRQWQPLLDPWLLGTGLLLQKLQGTMTHSQLLGHLYPIMSSNIRTTVGTTPLLPAGLVQPSSGERLLYQVNEIPMNPSIGEQHLYNDDAFSYYKC